MVRDRRDNASVDQILPGFGEVIARRRNVAEPLVIDKLVRLGAGLKRASEFFDPSAPDGGRLGSFLAIGSVTEFLSSIRGTDPAMLVPLMQNVTRSTRPAKTSVVGLLFAAIDCLTRSYLEHLCLSLFFHNRDRPCFNPGMRAFRKGSSCAKSLVSQLPWG